MDRQDVLYLVQGIELSCGEEGFQAVEGRSNLLLARIKPEIKLSDVSTCKHAVCNAVRPANRTVKCLMYTAVPTFAYARLLK